jgi:hypothetical protein
MRVAAHDGHARLGDTQLGADDVDDPLVLVTAREQRDAELVAVLLQRLELTARDRVLHRRRDRVGRDVVVGRGERAVGTTHRTVVEAKTVEGLGARHLVDQVQVNVDEGRLAWGRGDDVLVP